MKVRGHCTRARRDRRDHYDTVFAAAGQDAAAVVNLSVIFMEGT